MKQHGAISADSHVTEPADLWLRNLPARLRDRAPYVRRADVDGMPGLYLFLEGIAPSNVANGLAAGKKPEELPEFFRTVTLDMALRGGFDPVARIADMDAEGVAAEILYTTFGFRMFWLRDAELQRECFRVYNDWLAEFCSHRADRLIGVGLISLYDVGAAVRELRRCAALGLRGAMIWCSPPADLPYSDRRYDPFWAAAEELAMPVSLHAITGMGPESQWSTADRYVRFMVFPMEVQRTLTTLVFAGVLQRFPGLRLVSAENEIGWLPFFLQRIDQLQEEFRHLKPVPLELRASDYVHRQVWATFVDDAEGLAMRGRIGVERIAWSSDYPHGHCNWPGIAAGIERTFQRVPAAERERITRQNVIELYRLGSAP